MAYNFENIERWREIASEYSGIIESRHKYVFPFLCSKLDMLATENSRLFDFGCGDGAFIRNVFETTKISAVSAFDPTPGFRVAAEELFGDCRSSVDLWAEFPPAQNQKFDFVTINAVWMTLGQKRECVALLESLRDLLKGDGFLFATVTHPCFRENAFEHFSTNFSNLDYFNSGTAFTVEMFDENSRMKMHDFHWNLQDMLEQANAAGYFLERLWEHGEKNKAGSSWMTLAFRLRSDGRADCSVNNTMKTPIT